MNLDNTLLTLLPTHTSFTLPKPLTSLATALYAQSRSKASTLKPEEEIARGYACAELAAQRLKGKLNLSKIHSRPPCAPKVYKKLYTFLDGLLSAKAAPRQDQTQDATPTKRNAAGAHVYSTPTKAPPGRVPSSASKSLATPTKRPIEKDTEEHDIPTRGASTSTPNKRRKFTSDWNPSPSDGGKGLPEWVPRVIRHFCKKYEVPEAVVHVYVGVVTISKSPDSGLELTSRRKGDDTLGAQPGEKVKLCALTIAIVYIVLDHLLAIVPDVDMIKDSVHDLIALRCITPRQAGEVTLGAKKMLEEKTEGWREMEWFSNIVSGGNSGAIEARMALDSDDELGDGDDSGVVRPSKAESNDTSHMPMYGLGTMRQARTDWLSEERRADYRKWKAGIMKKIEQIERQQAKIAAR